MGDDIDGVVCLAFAFELLLGELPGFFDGGDGDLVGLFAEDVEVFRTGDDVDGVGEGGVQIFKGDEEGDGEAVAQALFHIDQVLVLEAAEVGGGFHDVFGFDHGDDDAAFLGGDLSRGVALGSLIQVRVLRIAAGGDDGDVGLLLHRDFLEAVGLLRAFEPCFVGVAADHGGDAAFFIDDGVDEEAGVYHVAGFLHVAGYGISFDL